MQNILKWGRRVDLRRYKKRERVIYEYSTRNEINSAIAELNMRGTSIIRGKENALRAVEELYKYKGEICGWDTETINVDVKTQSPVGNGTIICASAFAGPQLNFGNGPSNIYIYIYILYVSIGLFIDNYGDAEGTIDYFKDYLEDNSMLKCWHNYGFDRHILYNHGIDVMGFGADTMHMARLADPSRIHSDYSLANLSLIYSTEIAQTKEQIINYQIDLASEDELSNIIENIRLYEEVLKRTRKIDLKRTFGFYKKLKDGSSGKILAFPDLEEMHTSEQYARTWVEYSAFDAEITYYLRECLALELVKLKTPYPEMDSLYELYIKYWRPFGDLLTSMEREGFLLDLPYLKVLIYYISQY